MNLNMVFSFHAAERGQTYPVPPLGCLWLCLSGGFMQRLGSASARSTAMRIHGKGLQSGKPRSGQASLQCLLPDSLLVWSGQIKRSALRLGCLFHCRHFSVLILSQPEHHLALSLPLCRCHCLQGILVQAALLPALLFFRVCGGHVGHFFCAGVFDAYPAKAQRSSNGSRFSQFNQRVCQFCISLT